MNQNSTTTADTIATIRSGQRDPIAEAQQHLAAAKALGLEISEGLAVRCRDLAQCAAFAKAVESIPVGVREECAQLAEHLGGVAMRMERILTQGGRGND